MSDENLAPPPNPNAAPTPLEAIAAISDATGETGLEVLTNGRYVVIGVINSDAAARFTPRQVKALIAALKVALEPPPPQTPEEMIASLLPAIEGLVGVLYGARDGKTPKAKKGPRPEHLRAVEPSPLASEPE